MDHETTAAGGLPRKGPSETPLGPRRAISRVRDALASTSARIASSSGRGWSFWLVVILLGLVLPTPIAVPVIVARFRAGSSRPAP